MTAFAPISHPRRALLHPAWLASLALLALNDHVFKGSGTLPAPVTGKLSDFAGLMVAPLLLAVVLRVRGTTMWWAAHAAVGLVFTGIQVSRPFADMWSEAMGLVGFPWTITCDPTDLIALPVLVLSAWLYPRVTQTSARRLVRRNVETFAAAGGLVCCVATSPQNQTWTPTVRADVFLHNGADFPLVVRVRPLWAEVDIDCDSVAEAPGRLLSEPLFGEASSWTLEPDANMVLLTADESDEWGWDFSRSQGGCHAYLVDADNVEPTIVFWWEDQMQVVSVDGTGLDRELEGYVDIRYDDEGRGVIEAGSDVLYPMTEQEIDPQGQCAAADESQRLAWAGISIGEWMVGEVQEGIDGCVRFELRTGFQDQEDLRGKSSYVCLPTGAFPFESGDAISINSSSVGDTMPGEVKGLRIDEVDPNTGLVVEGGDALVLTSGEGLADVFGSTATYTDLLGCPLATEPACGTASRAGRLTLSGGELSTVELQGSGATATVPGPEGGELTVHLVHAQRRAALNPECASGPDTLGTDIDLVAVRHGGA